MTKNEIAALREAFLSGGMAALIPAASKLCNDGDAADIWCAALWACQTSRRMDEAHAEVIRLLAKS
jgi:hypothetical protein